MQTKEKVYPQYFGVSNEWIFNTIDLLLSHLIKQGLFTSEEFFVIDLGSNKGEICKNVEIFKIAQKKFAVEIDPLYLEQFQENPCGWNIIKADARNLKDIIMILQQKYPLMQPKNLIITINDLIEHLSEQDGKTLLEYITKELRPGICILSTPNGYFEQTPEQFPETIGHPHQRHLSGWEESDFHKFGFHTFVIAKRISPEIKFKTFPYAYVETIYAYYTPDTEYDEVHKIVLQEVVTNIIVKDMKHQYNLLPEGLRNEIH